MKLYFFVFLFIFLFSAFNLSFGEKRTLFKEDFESLKNWRSIDFPEDQNQTQYYSVKIEENWVLKTESKNSASGILNSHYFNPYKYKKLSWDWKVDSVFQKGDVSQREFSDLPIAVYIVFEYDPEKASMWEKIKYNAMKMIYGEYPPYRAICYAWANKENQKSFLFSAFTDRVAIITLQKGKENIGKWISEEVNFIQDYRFIYHEEPPQKASVGIMNDSDDTMESAISYIDNLVIFTEQNVDDE